MKPSVRLGRAALALNILLVTAAVPARSQAQAEAPEAPAAPGEVPAAVEQAPVLEVVEEPEPPPVTPAPAAAAAPVPLPPLAPAPLPSPGLVPSPTAPPAPAPLPSPGLVPSPTAPAPGVVVPPPLAPTGQAPAPAAPAPNIVYVPVYIQGPPPSVAQPAVAAPDAELLRRRYQAESLRLLPGAPLPTVRRGSATGPVVDELELALLAGRTELARTVERADQRARLPWLVAAGAVAAAGAGLILGGVAVDVPPLLARPACGYSPCSVGYDTALFDERYDARRELRRDREGRQLALVTSGGVLELAAAVLLTLALQAESDPQLDAAQRGELVGRANENLARRLGLEVSAPPP